MAYEIIDNYFSSEEDDEIVGQAVAAAAAGQDNHSNFVFESTQQNVPDEGFSFH